jgi:hypothetical protein
MRAVPLGEGLCPACTQRFAWAIAGARVAKRWGRRLGEGEREALERAEAECAGSACRPPVEG